jgi:hypothetical protein
MGQFSRAAKGFLVPGLSFRDHDGKEVCSLSAQPSPDPVYLQNGDKSQFFVRAGSTTQELSTKDAVDYIRTHWSTK